MDEKSSGNRQGWGKKRWNSPQTHGRITYPHLWKKENIIDSKMLSLSRPGFLWSFPPRRERKIKQDLKAAPNMKTRIQVCSYRFFLCFNPGQGRTAWTWKSLTDLTERTGAEILILSGNLFEGKHLSKQVFRTWESQNHGDFKHQGSFWVCGTRMIVSI